jgi:hypothetical protein
VALRRGPSISARMLRSATEVSTKTAPMSRSTSRSTKLADALQAGLASVEMPWMPITS